MPTTYKTPGVYIREENAFPNSAVAVETAVPVFIGYTQKAERNGKTLVNKPTKINSFAEYVELFGKGFSPKFTVGTSAAGAPEQAPDSPPSSPPSPPAQAGVKLDAIKIKENNTAYFYNSIRLFYANGGSACYILSVNTYENKDTLEVKQDELGNESLFGLLRKEYEPTLIVMPDAIILREKAYNSLYTAALQHCSDVQSRMCIFDLKKQLPTDVPDELVEEFRTGIGANFLNYGTAYYPWLKTAIVQPDELDYRNIDSSVADLATLLPQPNPQNDPGITKNNDSVKKIVARYIEKTTHSDDEMKNFHQSLTAASPVYTHILEEIRSQLNELPPSGAMAGIYTMVDNTRGVWKAPANVSLSLVDAPAQNISDREQESLNVDVMGGKSINVIRPFPGIGTLVWGGRTLDGNSQDWRYINVRRTLIMIEQSLKLATRAYVFEPNDAGTWITIKSMISNFLNNLWKQGALAGAVPEQAYDVQIGLGATMTPNDILDGLMRITVKVAIVHPAEFIIITFQQMQQQS